LKNALRRYWACHFVAAHESGSSITAGSPASLMLFEYRQPMLTLSVSLVHADAVFVLSEPFDVRQ
jgi:hypothetical protein